MDQFNRPPAISAKEYFPKLEEKFKSIRSKVYNSIPDEELINFEQEIKSYVKYLKDKYPDIYKRAVFHALVGSTLDPAQEHVYEDFPGDDSAEKFLEGLEAKYK